MTSSPNSNRIFASLSVTAANAERMYQPIWERMKSQGSCAVTAHPALHPRIIKAVIKEKYNDLGFKMLLDEAGIPWARISYRKDQSLIYFSLRKGIGLGTL